MNHLDRMALRERLKREAATEAAIREVHGIPLLSLVELTAIASVEMLCLLAELENPSRAGIGERREAVLQICADIARHVGKDPDLAERMK